MQINAAIRGVVRHGTDASVELACGTAEPDCCEIVFTMKNCPRALYDYLTLPGDDRHVVLFVSPPDGAVFEPAEVAMEPRPAAKKKAKKNAKKKAKKKGKG